MSEKFNIVRTICPCENLSEEYVLEAIRLAREHSAAASYIDTVFGRALVLYKYRGPDVVLAEPDDTLYADLVRAVERRARGST